MEQKMINLVLESRIVAIVRGLDDGYVPLAQAMYDGGIRAIEVTFNQKDPSQWVKTTNGIRQIKEAMGEKMLVGAGTVTSVELAELAYEAGAQFIVSPDINEEVIRRTKELGMLSMPGALTPTEVLSAYKAGADFVKVFPAGPLGSSYVKAIKAPLSHIKFLAVGGIDETNMQEYLDAGVSGFGIGSNITNKKMIDNNDWAGLTALAKKYVEVVCHG